MHGLLRQRAVIQRAETVTTESGEVQRIWSTLGPDVPCNVEAIRGSYRQTEAGRLAGATYFGIFRADEDLLTGDHVVFGQTIFEVAFVADMRGRHLEADLVRVIV